MYSLEYLKSLPEFDNNYKIVELSRPEIGLFGFVSIHRHIKDYPALGATRFWKYENKEEALRDALRLSRLMTYKSILAGLPFTGAKAVLIDDGLKKNQLKDFFKVYVEEINKLQGEFVTGTDVGVSNEDLEVMRQNSSYVIGTGVDSGFFTAQGVFLGIKVALKKVFGTDDIAGRTFAIQGLGKTGWPLLDLLLEHGAKKIYVSDLKKSTKLKAFFKSSRIQILDNREIALQEVDVFSPCALSGAVNKDNRHLLRCKIVAGSANNQLDSMETAIFLKDAGILYAPDFVINAGGLISVVDQYENDVHNPERIINKIQKIGESLNSIFDRSRQENKSTLEVAESTAAEKISSYV
ncbi:MAG: hypothetical protein HY979_02290 [Candidatus Magasanikbacteria bacterium]|nr:hypothetical protein [Candidatus Magasanikbacteria bacterium]